jgi:hypothetical protein
MEKYAQLKESREKLRKYIELRYSNESYTLDLKKYDQNIVDPRLLHVKTNGDILILADSSIKKLKFSIFRMYVNKILRRTGVKRTSSSSPGSSTSTINNLMTM